MTGVRDDVLMMAHYADFLVATRSREELLVELGGVPTGVVPGGYMFPSITAAAAAASTITSLRVPLTVVGPSEAGVLMVNLDMTANEGGAS